MPKFNIKKQNFLLKKNEKVEQTFNKKDSSKNNDSEKQVNETIKDNEISKDNSFEDIDVSQIKSFKYISILNKEKKFFMGILIVLLIVILTQGVLIYKLFSEKTTLILPANTSKEFWVTDKELSESYFEQVSYYIADRILSLSPGSVKNSLSSIIGFFGNNPVEVRNLKKKIEEQINYVQKENLYQIFYPTLFKPDYKNKILCVV